MEKIKITSGGDLSFRPHAVVALASRAPPGEPTLQRFGWRVSYGGGKKNWEKGVN